jgi:Flp pilus assembly protein TadD
MSARDVAAALLVLCSTAPASAMPTGRDGEAVRRADRMIMQVRLEEAERLLEPVATRHPNDPDVLELVALLAFHDGDYGDAVTVMDRAIAQGGDAAGLADRRALRALIAATHDATEHFERAASPDGRFVVMYAPGRDEVLVPYALEAMAAADRAIGGALGVTVPGPVRLEIYPTAASLAEVSTLTVEEIERTGTIALCKWDRLMITSPRALVRGYPWTDTIGHEYVHLALSRASNDQAPVWLQEGIAKFLERSWRGEAPTANVEPAAEALLDAAARGDGLIPFDRLHPSIARLPSQEDAALAFAQVATFVEAFHGRHGDDGLRDAIRRIAGGEDARDALVAVAGEPWARLEARWKEALRARPASRRDPPRLIALRFRHGAGEVDESAEVEVEQARRHLRLGDLLWGRGRPGAASVEYGKAQEAAPDDPIVASRYGRAALASGRTGPAITALERVRDRYPDHAPLHAILGAALAAEGRAEPARTSLREAIRINPFDPAPHCDLTAVAEHDTERRRETQACRALGGTLP